MPRRKKIRIAYARLSQETNAFSPEETRLEHFHRLPPPFPLSLTLSTNPFTPDRPHSTR